MGPHKVFQLREKKSGLCLSLSGAGTSGETCENARRSSFQQGNVDREQNPGKCCSGIRVANDNDCLDYFNQNGANLYSCDVSGNNRNQHYRFRPHGDGFLIAKGMDSPETCLFLESKHGRALQKKPCNSLQEGEGIWEEHNSKET